MPGEGATSGIYGAPASPAGLEASPAVKGTQEAPAWCSAGLWSLHLGGCPATSGRTLDCQGPGRTLVGSVTPLPFSLCSYLSLCSGLSWMQIYAAKSER